MPLNEKFNWSLIVYNSNDPELFCVIDCEGYTLTPEQYQEIEKKCEKGPYLGFFKTFPESIFRIRGPYTGKEGKFYIVDSTGLLYDDTQRDIAAHIEKELRKNERRQNGGKTRYID